MYRTVRDIDGIVRENDSRMRGVYRIARDMHIIVRETFTEWIYIVSIARC